MPSWKNWPPSGANTRLLHEVCGGLEKLGELGAAELFWSGLAANGEADDDHLRRVRSRVDEFQQQPGCEIEGSREAVLEKIRREQDEQRDSRRRRIRGAWQEEQRKLEWIVEREISELPIVRSVMPWPEAAKTTSVFGSRWLAFRCSSVCCSVRCFP